MGAVRASWATTGQPAAIPAGRMRSIAAWSAGGCSPPPMKMVTCRASGPGNPAWRRCRRRGSTARSGAGRVSSGTAIATERGRRRASSSSRGSQPTGEFRARSSAASTEGSTGAGCGCRITAEALSGTRMVILPSPYLRSTLMRCAQTFSWALAEIGLVRCWCLPIRLQVLCGSGFPAATIEAESLSHKEQTCCLIY